MSDNIKVELSYTPIDTTTLVAPEVNETMSNVVNGNLYIPFTNRYGKGQSNLFPETLMFYAKNCVWHSQLIGFKKRQTAGMGATSVDDDETTNNFLEQKNSKNKDVSEQITDMAFDNALYGGVALLVIWNAEHTQVVATEHVDFSKLRSAPVDKNGKVKYYLYCWDWRFFSTYKVVKIPVFDPSKKNERTQIIYSFDYGIGGTYYPIPDYISCLPSIRADMNGDVYAEQAMGNGISETTWVNLVGTMSDAEFTKQANELLSNYAGAKNTGKPMITRSQTKEKAPIIGKAGVDSKEDRFSSLSDRVRQKILTAHSITSPLLAGIAMPGALGNRDEINVASNLFYVNWVKSAQKKITDVFNMVMKVNGLSNIKIMRAVIEEEEEDNND